MQVRVRQIVETPKINQHALKSVKNPQNSEVGTIRTMMKKPKHCTDGVGEEWGGVRGVHTYLQRRTLSLTITEDAERALRHLLSARYRPTWVLCALLNHM